MVSTQLQKPRLGLISFINTLPVTLPILTGRVQLDAECILDEPAALNRGYQNGSLELGAMSAFYFLQSEMSLIPHLCIAGNGAVGSVLFFSKIEPRPETPLRIAVPEASATSINLLKVLLAEEFGLSPQLVPMAQPDFAMDISSVLVFGDHALSVDATWSQTFWRKDLSEWWHERFDLPMVFGVWAARRQWQKANKHKFEQLGTALLQALNLGLGEEFPRVLSEAKLRTGLAEERLNTYFRDELDLRFTARHQAGLAQFEALCGKHGLLQKANPALSQTVAQNALP